MEPPIHIDSTSGWLPSRGGCNLLYPPKLFKVSGSDLFGNLDHRSSPPLAQREHDIDPLERKNRASGYPGELPGHLHPVPQSELFIAAICIHKHLN